MNHQTITRKVPLGEVLFAGQFPGWTRPVLLKFRLPEQPQRAGLRPQKPRSIKASATRLKLPAVRDRPASSNCFVGSDFRNGHDVSDHGSITRAPSRLLLRIAGGTSGTPALRSPITQRSCYQVQSRASFQPKTARSSTLRSSIIQCVLHCSKGGNGTCANCKCNNNSFADRRSFGDRRFRNRQRTSGVTPNRPFGVTETRGRR